jgi:hypothetical protein
MQGKGRRTRVVKIVPAALDALLAFSRARPVRSATVKGYTAACPLGVRLLGRPAAR